MAKQDPNAKSAEEGGLVYVRDDDPGLRRKRAGRGFSYVDANGRVVRDARTLQRIRALAIPPAWKDVWISPRANGHVQATGRDARGRKQYRYHARWSTVRDAEKFERIIAFGAALPKLRRACAATSRSRACRAHASPRWWWRSWATRWCAWATTNTRAATNPSA
jgi:DNA topoisomerase IB